MKNKKVLAMLVMNRLRLQKLQQLRHLLTDRIQHIRQKIRVLPLSFRTQPGQINQMKKIW
mgnify:CR=1 FL=1